jgi:hypothetical protein
MTEHSRESNRIYRLLLMMTLAAVFCLPVHSQSGTAPSAPSDTKLQSEKDSPQARAATSQDPGTAVPRRLSEEEVRQAEIEADTKKLHLLSAELREEVGKTYKESLSITVLKKAEEVEKLARSLRALMNQEAAAGRK